LGTHHRGSADEVLALDTYIKLARASDTLVRQLARSLKAEGLSTSQLGLLELLWHLGPMCQRAVAEKMLQSGGNVTTVVDNLEARGLVRRERNEHDRRFVTLNLTEEGRALIADVFPRHAARITQLMGVLAEDECRALGVLLRKLGKLNETPEAAAP
jgi:MarR family 2-MHQ and catechol resistance regulon transcriptional repressor